MQTVHTGARLRALSSLLLTLVLTAGFGLAQQPLAAYTPAGSLLTIGFFEETPVGTALKDDLESLDWAGGAETFMQLAEAMGTPADLSAMFGSRDSSVLDMCPAAAALMEDEAYDGAAWRGLFSVGFSPFNPVPAATVLLELEPDHRQLAQDSLAALLDCALEGGLAEVHELEQDGTPFWQVVVDYELNLAVTVSDGILAVSSSPDQLRQVLRLQAGSGEPSMADSRLHDTWLSVERGVSGIDWMVDFAALADLAELFGAGIEAGELGSELARSLRSAGGMAGSLSFSAGELVYVNHLLPDRSGGDSQLVDLLLSEGLELAPPPLLPSGGVLVSSQVLNVHGFFSYVERWLEQLRPLAGGELDLRELFTMAGADLDTMLLDWIGTDMHVVQLEPSFTALSLIRGPGQLVMIATEDAQAAEAGAAELVGLLSSLSELDPEMDFGFDSRSASWRGVDYTRLRVGPLTDLSYAVLDDYLVIGTPLSVMHQAIDLHLDGGSADAPAVFSSGSGLLSVQNYALGRDLGSAADLLGSFTQPLAFIMRNVALEEVRMAEWRDSWELDSTDQHWPEDMTYGWVDLSGIEPQPLLLGESAGGVMNMADGEAFFELQGLSVGDAFTVRMESVSGDSRLELIDRSTGDVLAYNDDYLWPDLHAQINFTATAGSSYVVRADFFGMEETATDFTVSFALQPEADAAEPVTVTREVPTFGALLDMFDLIPQATRIVAARTGNLEGMQERRGDTVYSRYVLQADW